MDELPVREEYFDRFYRVVRVESARGERVYSIDYYARLPARPVSCSDSLLLDPVEICYVKISLCEAVILISRGGRVELINLRLKTDTTRDPAGGSLERARSICYEEAARLIEAMHSSIGREG